MLTIKVYGSSEICPSCVQAPSSKDTFEWIQAALTRRYEGVQMDFQYIDIQKEPSTEVDKKMVEQIVEEDMFYPVICINGFVVAEGNASLPKIVERMEMEIK
ncbi:DUF1462 family protein [Mangrovibacillus cuniculi]|uniref:DUF1462 family protein n=1 Tax=Mangrovibacillus cuniculi TaxID=2593652 RepID=A0A7S8HG40_9BACI|nr:DUF1462 family protein [Mangrovibacillus cuniculi]QPC47377.1 DUF1462 family protein [Mangrovibacillus cuniculi]